MPRPRVRGHAITRARARAALRQAKAVFVDQAPLQNRAPGWDLGSKGCYDEATLRGLQKTLAEGIGAIADGNEEGKCH